jgi:hypothetical protein
MAPGDMWSSWMIIFTTWMRARGTIVDEFFSRTFDGKITYEELYSGYTTFGEDPFIVSGDKDCFFSAWDYAKRRCRELTARD